MFVQDGIECCLIVLVKRNCNHPPYHLIILCLMKGFNVLQIDMMSPIHVYRNPMANCTRQATLQAANNQTWHDKYNRCNCLAKMNKILNRDNAGRVVTEAVSNPRACYFLYCYIEKKLLKGVEVINVCLTQLVRGLFPTNDGSYLTPKSAIPPCQGRIPMRTIIIID